MIQDFDQLISELDEKNLYLEDKIAIISELNNQIIAKIELEG